MGFFIALGVIGLLAWPVHWVGTNIPDASTRCGMWIGAAVASLLVLFLTLVSLGYNSETEILLASAVWMVSGMLVGGVAGWLWGGLFEWIAPPRQPAADPSDEEFVERL
jgi:hypothetical protein